MEGGAAGRGPRRCCGGGCGLGAGFARRMAGDGEGRRLRGVERGGVGGAGGGGGEGGGGVVGRWGCGAGRGSKECVGGLEAGGSRQGRRGSAWRRRVKRSGDRIWRVEVGRGWGGDGRGRVRRSVGAEVRTGRGRRAKRGEGDGGKGGVSVGAETTPL